MSEHTGAANDLEALERTRVSASEVSWALREAIRADAAARRRLRGAMALRPMDYAALEHVMDHIGDSAIGPRELAGLIGISTGSTTELLDRLERSGHIQRQRHPGDRRRQTLHPSDQSVTVVIDHLRPLLTVMDDIAADLPEDDQAAVAGYLRRVATAMRGYAAETAQRVNDGEPRP